MVTFMGMVCIFLDNSVELKYFCIDVLECFSSPFCRLSTRLCSNLCNGVIQMGGEGVLLNATTYMSTNHMDALQVFTRYLHAYSHLLTMGPIGQVTHFLSGENDFL